MQLLPHLPSPRPLLDYITSGPVVALELITTDAVKKWRTTLGPTDSQEARNVAPDSIRALFGKDKQSNAGHGSDSDISAIRVSARHLILLLLSLIHLFYHICIFFI